MGVFVCFMNNVGLYWVLRGALRSRALIVLGMSAEPFRQLGRMGELYLMGSPWVVLCLLA